jgi:hypothetical protein
MIGTGALCCATALLVACGSASAGSFGTYTADGKTMTLNSGYAWPVKGGKITKVAICDVAKIDPAPLNAVTDYRYNAFYAQISKGNPGRGCVELEINSDGQLEGMNTNNMNGLRMGIVSNDNPADYKLDVKRNDGKRIEGTMQSTDELKKRRNTEFNLKFDFAVAPTPSQN